MQETTPVYGKRNDAMSYNMLYYVTVNLGCKQHTVETPLQWELSHNILASFCNMMGTMKML